MKKQITRISPVQSAKVIALQYFLFSIPLVALMAIPMMASPRHPSMIFLIIFPFMYLIFGFIFTLLGSWIYNVAAGWVGGIEYVSTEMPD